MINKEFFVGGNAIFTVQNPSGEYYTFKIRQPSGDKPYFVSLMSGSNVGYIGILDINQGLVRLTHKSKFKEDDKIVRVIRWAISLKWNNKTLPTGYQIRHEGRCGCCGKELTTPESLDIGLGPVCAKRLGY